MAEAFSWILCSPGGTSENSPGFQAWDRRSNEQKVPQGRLKSPQNSTRPKSAMRPHSTRFYTFAVVVLILALQTGGSPAALNTNGTGQISGKSASNVFRVMTWNIHHGEGLDRNVDLERIASLIRTQQVDIVALQEVDKGVQRTKGHDLPAELATLSGMSVVFSNNYSFQGGEYGNAILSRFPILSASNLHYQKVNETEQRGLLQAVVEVRGRKVVIFDTHLDHRRPDDARWSNVAEIEEALQGIGAVPVLICGDFNSPPEGRVYERLGETLVDAWATAGNGRGFTIPAEKPDRRIDYIWIRKDSGLVPGKVWVPESVASDHRPVVAEIQFKGP
jgi:endonuclease/exonuclease/phosphatase family metal-dependent hydrolase